VLIDLWVEWRKAHPDEFRRPGERAAETPAEAVVAAAADSLTSKTARAQGSELPDPPAERNEPGVGPPDADAAPAGAKGGS
jgi:hypothetical protein